MGDIDGNRSLKLGAAPVAAVCLFTLFFVSNASAKRVLVTDIRVWSTPRYARVVIHLDGPALFTYNRLRSPNRIYVDIKGAVLRLRENQKKIQARGVLKGVRVGRNIPSVPRIVLDLNKIGSYKVFSLAAPTRIVVDVEAPRPKPVAARRAIAVKWGPPASEPRPNTTAHPQPKRKDHVGPTPKGSSIPAKPVKTVSPPRKIEKRISPDEWSLAERFRRGLGKIVIDPGHGGKDPGAIGRTGVYEKQLVLDIANRLARALRRRLKAKVLLTRTRDNFIPLEERTAFANTQQADLFVSIHANSSPSRRLHGIETYLLSEATDERALKVAARENGVPVKELNDLQVILSDLRMRGQINQSVPFAESVQEEVISYLSRRYSRVRNLGVKQAPFYVLLGAQMPSVLVEVGFLSNRLGERRLKSPKYRQFLATSISRGIRRFVKQKRLARQLDEPQ